MRMCVCVCVCYVGCIVCDCGCVRVPHRRVDTESRNMNRARESFCERKTQHASLPVSPPPPPPPPPHTPTHPHTHTHTRARKHTHTPRTTPHHTTPHTHTRTHTHTQPETPIPFISSAVSVASLLSVFASVRVVSGTSMADRSKMDTVDGLCVGGVRACVLSMRLRVSVCLSRLPMRVCGYALMYGNSSHPTPALRYLVKTP